METSKNLLFLPVAETTLQRVTLSPEGKKILFEILSQLPNEDPRSLLSLCQQSQVLGFICTTPFRDAYGRETTLIQYAEALLGVGVPEDLELPIFTFDYLGSSFFTEQERQCLSYLWIDFINRMGIAEGNIFLGEEPNLEDYPDLLKVLNPFDFRIQLSYDDFIQEYGYIPLSGPLDTSTDQGPTSVHKVLRVPIAEIKDVQLPKSLNNCTRQKVLQEREKLRVALLDALMHRYSEYIDTIRSKIERERIPEPQQVCFHILGDSIEKYWIPNVYKLSWYVTFGGRKPSYILGYHITQ
jgi:hypothetical protein